MTLSTWLPDGPVGWILLAVLVLALGWWAYRKLSTTLFALGGAAKLARERNWLIKSGEPGNGDFPGGGAAEWETTTLPGTCLELLGEHQGFVFHAREQRTRVTSSAGHPGEPSYRWRHDYVVALATTTHPYDGFFTASPAAPITDWRRALYPAFLQWEGPIFQDLDSGIRPPEGGVRSGSGLISVEHRDERMTSKRLLADLDLLVARARG